MIFTLFPISLRLHTGLIPISKIQITRCSQFSIFLFAPPARNTYQQGFHMAHMFSHYILFRPASKIETLYISQHFPSTLSCIFFYNTYIFLSMLSVTIFMIYCLCSSLKYKVYKSKDFFLFIYCCNPSTHKDLYYRVYSTFC